MSYDKRINRETFFLACLILAASTASASAQFHGWGPSYQYDSGWNPNVAQYGSTVVEVHNGSGPAGTTSGIMWWKVGQVQSNNTIAWGQSGPYDSGWNPNVALYGTTVVEVHNGSKSAAGPMWYKVGHVQSNNAIAWGHSWQYDSGLNPNVAVYGSTVVEVHNGSGPAGTTSGTMWWKVGQIQSNNTILWLQSGSYDSGWNPNVAIYGTTVVEVHNGSGTAGPMWYKVGQIQSNNTIAWGHSWQYDSGWNPKVALYGTTTVVEVHNGADAPGPMWYHWGFWSGGTTINFGNSDKYDWGYNPSVAVGDIWAPVEVHDGGVSAGSEWYHVGQVYQPH